MKLLYTAWLGKQCSTSKKAFQRNPARSASKRVITEDMRRKRLPVRADGTREL